MALSAAGLPPIDDHQQVRFHALRLGNAANALSYRADGIDATWAQLTPHYVAPESGTLLEAMHTPQQSAVHLDSKVGTAQDALVTFADRLQELEAQRDALAADITEFNARREAELADGEDGIPVLADVSGWVSGGEKADLLEEEEALNDRAIALAVALKEAENACANTINGLWPGGDHWDLAGDTSVDDPTVNGATESVMNDLSKAGETPWGSPAGWTDVNWGTGYRLTIGGIGDSMRGSAEDLMHLAGMGDDGAVEATRSGLAKVGKALITPQTFIFTGEITPEQVEALEIQASLGKSAIGYGTWGTSPYNTAGGFLPDLAGLALTGGAATAGKVGLKAALDGALRGLAGKVPSAPAKVGALSSALRATGRGALDDAMNGLRNAAGGARERVGELGRSLGPEPSFPGVGRLDGDLGGAGRGGWSRPDSPGVLHNTADGGGGGARSAGGPDGVGGSGRFDGPGGADGAAGGRRGADGAGAGGGAGLRGGSGGPDGAGGPRSDGPGGRPPYEGDPHGSGMLGRPPEHLHQRSLKKGDPELTRLLEPNSRSLEPRTRYDVEGRGTYFTDGEGRVRYVEPVRRRTVLGHLRPSPDLRNPLPDTTYKSNGVWYHTDEHGRTAHVHVEDLRVSGDTKRSVAAQREVVKKALAQAAQDLGSVTKAKQALGPRDGGHLLARFLGGAKEEINLDSMPRDFNRGWNGRSLEQGNSMAAWESAMKRAVNEAPGGTRFGLDLRLDRGPDGELESLVFEPTRNGELLSELEITMRNK